jgi:hypothetical protein
MTPTQPVVPTPAPAATPVPTPVSAPKPLTTAELAAKSPRFPLVVFKDGFGQDHPAIVTGMNADESVDMIVFNRVGTSIGRSKVVHGFDLNQWHTYDEPVPAYTPTQIASALQGVNSAQSAVDAAQTKLDNQAAPGTPAAQQDLKAAKAGLASAQKTYNAMKAKK